MSIFGPFPEIENLTSNNIVLSLTRHEFNVHTKIGKMMMHFAKHFLLTLKMLGFGKQTFNQKIQTFD